MRILERLADHDHELVRQTAERLIKGATSEREMVRRLFCYVRDDIRFGFVQNGDIVKASETIRLGIGQCNTKGALFMALCRAVGLPARMHFSLIDREIQRGLFTGLMYRVLPQGLSHGWVEVLVEDRWRRVDSYINDEAFYLAGKTELQRRGWKTGFSVSCESGESSVDLNLDEERFVQMDAVIEDHGIWDDPADYYRSERYRNRPGMLRLAIYSLMIWRINRRVDRMRNACDNGLCGVPAGYQPGCAASGA